MNIMNVTNTIDASTVHITDITKKDTQSAHSPIFITLNFKEVPTPKAMDRVSLAGVRS